MYCTACGKKASPDLDQQCKVESCPNICHAASLDDELEFTCESTRKLRHQLSIPDTVTFVVRNKDAEGSTTTSPTVTDELEDDDLLDIPMEELVLFVENLRQELASKKTVIAHY